VPVIPSKLPRRYHAHLSAGYARLRLFLPKPPSGPAAVIDPGALLYPHTVWDLDLNRLLEGKTLLQATRRHGWSYYFHDERGKLTAAKLQISPGQHESISFAEGLFVRKLVGLIEQVHADPRLKRTKVELRTLFVPPLHFACIWLRVAKGSAARGARTEDIFVPATRSPGNSTARSAQIFGKWISAQELLPLLLEQGRSLRASQQRSAELLKGLRPEHKPKPNIPPRKPGNPRRPARAN
jgi:hypothetical protein